MGKLKGKRPHGKHRRIWDNNIKMDLQKLGCNGMDWIVLTQNRDRWRASLNTLINIEFFIKQ